MHASCRLQIFEAGQGTQHLTDARLLRGRCRIVERMHHLQERAQYLHQFVMHAALDAVDEQLWSTSAMHLGVVDRFNNLQASQICCFTINKILVIPMGPPGWS